MYTKSRERVIMITTVKNKIYQTLKHNIRGRFKCPLARPFRFLNKL